MTENETLVKAIIEGAQEKKGRSITHVDLSGIETAATQGFVIVNGNTPIQVDAIADSIRERPPAYAHSTTTATKTRNGL